MLHEYVKQRALNGLFIVFSKAGVLEDGLLEAPLRLLVTLLQRTRRDWGCSKTQILSGPQHC